MRLLCSVVGVALLAVVGSVFMLQADVSAWSERVVSPTGDVRVNADEKPDGSLYVLAPAGEVVVAGKVNGDLYCAASDSVRINAEVTGSINCASMKITFKGEAGGSVRFAAQEVDVEGEVGGDLSIFATRAKIGEAASVIGDLNGSVSRLTVDGPVGGMLGSIGQVDINSRVGSLDVVSRSISLGTDAEIDGDVNYQISDSGEVAIDESKVGGEVTAHESEAGNVNPFSAYLTGLAFTVAIILSLATATLLPFSRLYRRVSDMTVGKMPFILLTGFMMLFAVPATLLLLALTVAGLPLALALVLLWLALMLASIGYTVYMAGSLLASAQSRMTPIWSYIAASLLLGLAITLPLVGVAVVLMILIFGSGSLVYAIFTYQFGSKKEVKADDSKKESKKIKTVKSKKDKS